MKKQNRVTILNIASTFILSGISIFTSPLFSRLLGTDGYGIMSTYTVWMNAMAIIATLQTDATLIYAKVKYSEDEQRQYHSAVMTLSLVSCALVCLLIFAFIKPIASLVKLSSGLIAMVLIQSFGSFCMNFLNTKLQYELKAGRNMLSALTIVLTSLGLSLVFVLSMPQQQRYIGRILGNVITYGTFGLAACAYILWKGRTFFNFSYWRFALKLVFPLMFMNLSYLVLGHSDLVMVRDFLGDSASGIYGLAYTFSGVLFTIFGALNKSWVPFFFDDMKAGNEQAVDFKTRNYLELFTVLSVGFILLTKEVFHVFASQAYWSGTMLIPIFAASYYLNFLCTFPVNFEHYHVRVRMVSVVTVVSAIINIGLNYVFIRSMGLAGAAVATLLSHCLQFIVHQLYASFAIKEAKYPFRIQLLGKYIIAFVLILVFSYVFDGSWIIRWLLGAVIGVWELLRIRNRKVLI